MKKLVPAVLLTVIAAARYYLVSPTPTPDRAIAASQRIGESVEQAIEGHANDVPVQGEGTVVKILPDDTNGIRHQRFLLRLVSGRKILIAHNLDLAPKVAPLHEGDLVVFSGEFEWNGRGGVVHWTHRDPSGRHHAGWLKHDGKMFQ